MQRTYILFDVSSWVLKFNEWINLSGNNSIYLSILSNMFDVWVWLRMLYGYVITPVMPVIVLIGCISWLLSRKQLQLRDKMTSYLPFCISSTKQFIKVLSDTYNDWRLLNPANAPTEMYVIGFELMSLFETYAKVQKWKEKWARKQKGFSIFKQPDETR